MKVNKSKSMLDSILIRCEITAWPNLPQNFNRNCIKITRPVPVVQGIRGDVNSGGCYNDYFDSTRKTFTSYLYFF